MGAETTTLDQLFTEYSATELNIAFISLILGFLFVAFLGFRFFKLSLIVSGAAWGYSFGMVTVGMIIGDSITAFNAAAIAGIASAIIFAILTPKFYKVVIYVYGGLLGALIGFVVPYATLSAFGFDVVGLITGIILAIVLAVPGAKLLYRIFKPYIIIGTSILGSIFAMAFVSLLIFRANEIAFEIFVLLGFVLGIFATVVQFKMNKDRELDL